MRNKREMKLREKEKKERNKEKTILSFKEHFPWHLTSSSSVWNRNKVTLSEACNGRVQDRLPRFSLNQCT